MNKIFIQEEKVINKIEFSNGNIHLLDRVNPLPGNTIFLELPDNVSDLKVGVISDVHQNSSLLRDVLRTFTEQDVKMIFLLGDYSFVSDSGNQLDKSIKRENQFITVLKLIETWINEYSDRYAVIILGNHDIDLRYYKTESNSILRQKYFFLDVIAKHPRIYTQQDPYFSYDNRNQVYFSIAGKNIGYRSFSLSHSINPKFVNLIYQGYSNETSKKEKQISNIKNELGEVYFYALEPLFIKGGELWTRFTQGEKNVSLIQQISDNIKYSLNTDNLVKLLTSFDNKFSDEAYCYINKFMYNSDNIENLYNQYLYNYEYHNEIGEEFFNGLRKIKRTIGDLPQIMYNLTGHFHIDLGVNKTSNNIGSFILGGSGMQPNKILADKFTCYIMNITYDFDTVFKVYTNHNPFNLKSDVVYDLSDDMELFKF